MEGKRPTRFSPCGRLGHSICQLVTLYFYVALNPCNAELEVQMPRLPVNRAYLVCQLIK